METKYLFVTGMFRSGTTLVAKMLAAHPEIVFASDPYRPFFNNLRDKIIQKNNLFIGDKLYEHLSSYFFSYDQLRAMKAVQNSTLDIPFSRGDISLLLKKMKKEAIHYSPLLVKGMDKIKGRTYLKIFRVMMKLVKEFYGRGDEKIIGIKEVWCNEFTKVLANSFSDMLFIHIVRDPRAVCASKNVRGEKYPWLFMIRQWRKLAIFSWLAKNVEEFKSRILVIRYEDLVKNPTRVTEVICSFLGLKFSNSMLDSNRFKDGHGKQWSQNSSYGTNINISTRSLEKWRRVLKPQEIQLIETLCYPEMLIYNYLPKKRKNESISPELFFNPPIVKKENLAKWIKRYNQTDLITNVMEMAKEAIRLRLISLPARKLKRVDKLLIESLFISKRYFYYIRRRINREN